MKFIVALFVALSLTIAWQTSVFAGYGGAGAQDAQTVLKENRESGRVPFSEEDCD